MRGSRNFVGQIGLASVALAAAIVLSGCAATPEPCATPEAAQKTVFVVHHGSLHTGLTVKRSDIPRGHWPASADYGDSRYIEVGWGDEGGYRKPLTSGIAMKALLGDRQTVLFAEGFSQPIRRKYSDPKFTVLAVGLSGPGLASLCDHIQQTYALNEKGQPIRLGGGWYRARGTYSAFNTCNTWVARGLREAGCPIDDTLCLTAGQLLGRVRPFAREISTRR
ncbi:MAG TPA: DUF2459 domain-containing protein [Chthoniobacterales bacterium]|nr:DUF2459 domain-containing protein [Chthoniobacterales bacterium]